MGKKEERCAQITDAFLRSKYFMAASGCRDVDAEELKRVIRLLLYSEVEEIDTSLSNLYEYHPDTIALNKGQARNCPDYREGCDCFLPQITTPLCKRLREEKLLTSDYRNTLEYKAWRTSVFERDNFTCVVCGQEGGELNAHHIKTFKKHPNLRYETGNGLTLCVTCHRAEHKKGNKNA